MLTHLIIITFVALFQYLKEPRRVQCLYMYGSHYNKIVPYAIMHKGSFTDFVVPRKLPFSHK